MSPPVVSQHLTVYKTSLYQLECNSNSTAAQCSWDSVPCRDKSHRGNIPASRQHTKWKSKCFTCLENNQGFEWYKFTPLGENIGWMKKLCYRYFYWYNVLPWSWLTFKLHIYDSIVSKGLDVLMWVLLACYVCSVGCRMVEEEPKAKRRDEHVHIFRPNTAMPIHHMSCGCQAERKGESQFLILAGGQ